MLVSLDVVLFLTKEPTLLRDFPHFMGSFSSISDNSGADIGQIWKATARVDAKRIEMHSQANLRRGDLPESSLGRPATLIPRPKQVEPVTPRTRYLGSSHQRRTPQPR